MDRIVVAVAIGMGLVFGTGIMVGIVAMIAAARGADEAGRRSRPPDTPGARAGYFGPDEQDDDDDPPWWQTRDGA